MAMFWIAVAAQMSAPLILDPKPLFSTEDVPAYIATPGTTALVLTRTTVRPDGKVQDCSVEQSSGNSKIDAYTCALLLKRRKFAAAAKWPDGSSAYGVIRLPVAWGSTPPLSKSPVDLEVMVNKLPDGMGSPAFAAASIAADEGGHLVSCQGTPLLLIQLACDQLTKTYTAIPAKDAEGKPVRSIQTAMVRFAIAAPPIESASKRKQ